MPLLLDHKSAIFDNTLYFILEKALGYVTGMLNTHVIAK